jgi:hypothetical protein
VLRWLVKRHTRNVERTELKAAGDEQWGVVQANGAVVTAALGTQQRQGRRSSSRRGRGITRGGEGSARWCCWLRQLPGMWCLLYGPAASLEMLPPSSNIALSYTESRTLRSRCIVRRVAAANMSLNIRHAVSFTVASRSTAIATRLLHSAALISSTPSAPDLACPCTPVPVHK